MTRFRRIIVPAVIIGAAVLLTACNAADYKKAEKAFTSGDYEEAQAIYSELGDYKDSADKELECRYQLADLSLSSGDFGEAREMFSSLEDYKDSGDKTSECIYGMAKEELAGSDYESAVKDLEELGDYSDAEELLSEATDKLIESRLPGTFESKGVDMSAFFLSYMKTLFGDSESFPEEAFENVELNIDMTIEFTEDGKVIETSSPQDYGEDELDSVKDAFSQAVIAYYNQLLEMTSEEQGISVDEVLAEFGASDVNELYEALFGVSINDLAEISIDDFLGSLDSNDEGTFEIKDGEITVDLSSGGSEVYTLDTEADVLTLTSVEDYEGIFQPIAFTRK